MTQFVPGGGDDELTIPLDTYAEADPFTVYPGGISIMGVSEAASWGLYGEAGTVTTHRVGTWGWQELTADDNEESWGYRLWSSVEEGWLSWFYPADVNHTHPSLPLAGLDVLAESAPATSYSDGINVMSVSAGANWGPNTGQAGIVETTTDGTNGTQTFTQYSNGNKFSRGYASGAWSAWVALQ